MGKRYYWLKLRDDFFDSKRIKKLRRLNPSYVIIYLKLQLKALQTDGVLEYSGIEEDFATELALDLDEKPSDVQAVIIYLLTYKMMEETDKTHFYLPYVAYNTGSETASTQRVRDFRQRQKALHCNTNETEVKRVGNAEKEIEIDIDTPYIPLKRGKRKTRRIPFDNYAQPGKAHTDLNDIALTLEDEL